MHSTDCPRGTSRCSVKSNQGCYMLYSQTMKISCWSALLNTTVYLQLYNCEACCALGPVLRLPAELTLSIISPKKASSLQARIHLGSAVLCTTVGTFVLPTASPASNQPKICLRALFSFQYVPEFSLREPIEVPKGFHSVQPSLSRNRPKQDSGNGNR
jgi:hypothetical protein